MPKLRLGVPKGSLESATIGLFDQAGSKQGVLASATRIAIVYADQGKYREAAERLER